MMASLDSMALLAQSNSGGGGGIGGMLMLLVWLAIVVVVIAGWWKTFEKAGQPGWGAIVPIYNIYLLTKIAGRPAWWVILFIIPIVGLVVAVIVSIDVAKSFGKSALFGVGLALLAPIFYCILGFGDAQYKGPAAANA